MMVQPCHNHGPVNKIERHYFEKSASCFLLCFQQLLLSFYVFSGATSAPCLIFIFPAIFYIRIVPKDKEPMSSTPKILVRPPPTPHHFWADWVVVAEHWAPVLLHTLPGCLLRCTGNILHGDESELHHHRLVDGRRSRRQGPLDGAAAWVCAPEKEDCVSEEGEWRPVTASGNAAQHNSSDHLQE